MFNASNHPLQAKRPIFKWDDEGAGRQMARVLNCYSDQAWAKELGAYIRQLNAAEQQGGQKHAEAVHRVNARLDSMKFKIQLVRTRDGLQRSLIPGLWDGTNGGTETAVLMGLAQIADLAALGELPKLHECVKCRRWFAAKRNRKDVRFCEERCQQSWNRKTPHGRAKNCEYVARSRGNAKRLQEMAKRQARADARNRKPGHA